MFSMWQQVLPPQSWEGATGSRLDSSRLLSRAAIASARRFNILSSKHRGLESLAAEPVARNLKNIHVFQRAEGSPTSSREWCWGIGNSSRLLVRLGSYRIMGNQRIFFEMSKKGLTSGVVPGCSASRFRNHPDPQ